MSRIQHLLRVAARRNEAAEYGAIRIRLLKKEIASLREGLRADGMSANVLFEAVVRGYLMRDPAVLAMIDSWKREERSKPEPKPLDRAELADIYAELGGGTLEED
jgi:hypothetical protein